MSTEEVVIGNTTYVVKTNAKKTDVGKIVAMVKKYSHITDLSPQILNELVDKAVVHQAEKVDCKRRQDIEVYFNGVGQISFDTPKKP